MFLYFFQFLTFISLALIIINEKKRRKIADLIGKTSDKIGRATSGNPKLIIPLTKPPIEIAKSKIAKVCKSKSKNILKLSFNKYLYNNLFN